MRSIPHIPFIVRHRIFSEECPILVLEGASPMVFLLVVDVGKQGIKIGRADRKYTVASLPCEV